MDRPRPLPVDFHRRQRIAAKGIARRSHLPQRSGAL